MTQIISGAIDLSARTMQGTLPGKGRLGDVEDSTAEAGNYQSIPLITV